MIIFYRYRLSQYGSFEYYDSIKNAAVLQYTEYCYLYVNEWICRHVVFIVEVESTHMKPMALTEMNGHSGTN